MKWIIWWINLAMIMVTLAGCGDETETELSGEVHTSTSRSETHTTSVIATTSVQMTATEPVTTISTEEALEMEQKQKVEALIATMTLEEKVGQLFYVSLPTYNNGKIPAGGVIFFKPDLGGKENLGKVTQDLRSSTIQPFVGIDEEGGIISRLSSGDYGVPKVPSAWDQAHSDDEGTVTENSRLLAEGLEALGFNMNFAPVADIHTNPDNPVIGHRAYSDNADEVAKYVLQSLKGYENTSVIPVVKHFPGHGDTHGDSHHNSVYIDGDLTELQSREMVPFQGAIDAGVDVVMMGHISVPEVSGEIPASLSGVMIKDILREEMDFQGLVISDSLIMKGITDNYTYEEVLEVGLAAGLDMFLIPEEPEAGYDYLLGQVKEDPGLEKRVDDAVFRILLLKLKYGMLAE